jgi:hypothetical protein
MIEYATALKISVAAQWMLLGGVGLVGTIAWEVFGLKTWIMRAISRQQPIDCVWSVAVGGLEIELLIERQVEVANQRSSAQCLAMPA